MPKSDKEKIAKKGMTDEEPIHPPRTVKFDMGGADNQCIILMRMVTWNLTKLGLNPTPKTTKIRNSNT